jgi:hypothetical protein
MTTALAGRVKRLERETTGYCPACADWPDEVTLNIIEVIVDRGPDGQLVEVDEDGNILGPVRDEMAGALKPNEQPDPFQLGPCECCGRVHRPKVVAITRERAGRQPPA